jgi:hypothetical protein
MQTHWTVAQLEEEIRITVKPYVAFWRSKVTGQTEQFQSITQQNKINKELSDYLIFLQNITSKLL